MDYGRREPGRGHGHEFLHRTAYRKAARKVGEEFVLVAQVDETVAQKIQEFVDFRDRGEELLQPDVLVED